MPPVSASIRSLECHKRKPLEVFCTRTYLVHTKAVYQRSDKGIRYRIDAISLYTIDLGVFLNLGRLRAHPENIIPALRDTLALFSSHLAQTPGSSAQQVLSSSPSESVLLSRALQSLAESFSAVNPRLGPQYYMQILQVQVLLAYYFHRVYQTPVAQCHANGAIAVAVGLGLHMRSSDGPTPGLFNFIANCHPRLPRPSDAVEEQERTGAWWTVYSLVKFLEMIHPGPPVVATAVRITVPWPGSNVCDIHYLCLDAPFIVYFRTSTIQARTLLTEIRLLSFCLLRTSTPS